MFVKVTHIKWDINKVLDWKLIECALYLIIVKISCNMLFCYSYSFGETWSHEVSFDMLCVSVRLGGYAAFRLGRGQQRGFVNDVFDSVFLYFLLFSCFLLSILTTQCLNRDLSLVKRFYDEAVSRQAAVRLFQIPEYGDP